MRNQAVRYSGELDFLNDLKPAGTNLYKTASWLLSDFSATTWDIKFTSDETVRTINFAVRMSDGSMLTDPRHSEILNTFKHWLCVQTHPHANSSKRLSGKTARNRIHRTLHLIDYLLLNQNEIDLVGARVGGLTGNTLFALVSAVASCNDVSEGIYGWSAKLGQFLRRQGESLTPEDIDSTVVQTPELRMELVNDGSLGLSAQELLAARTWLFRNGYFRSNAGAVRSGALLHPNTTSLAKKIYANTLWGVQKRSYPTELSIEGQDIKSREKNRVPVVEFDDERPIDKNVAVYIACIQNLALVERTGLRVPTVALRALRERNISTWLDVKEVGRFQLPPQDVVLKTLRCSLEFSLTYGPALVETYLALANLAASLNQSFAAVAASKHFDQLLPTNLRELGVKSWRINGASADFFDRLRKSESFIDLMIVLIGSIIAAVGIVMARRQGELHDLDVFTCLDETGRNLVFMNRKSGESDYRQRELRPIPPIVVELIQMLQRLQRGLVDLGLLTGSGALFRYPHRKTGLMISSSNGIYRCVDRLCDYIALPGREEGTRYYLRQHQFRRFFAVAFFWGSGFGGLDTLRWFLGQNDPTHVWRYVLESVPGKILMAVQSQYAIEKLLAEDPSVESLADLLSSKFGTRDFSVLSTSELAIYIESLLESGNISVEPHFLEDDKGTRYQILVVVKNRNSSGGFHGI